MGIGGEDYPEHSCLPSQTWGGRLPRGSQTGAFSSLDCSLRTATPLNVLTPGGPLALKELGRKCSLIQS